MKRARRDDERSIDPVYPFGVEQVTPMPPFVDAGSGIKVDGLKLSVNFSNPIIAKNGALTLKLGNGLYLDSAGQLSANEMYGLVQLPLEKDNNMLKLNVGNTLDANTILNLKIPSKPLEISNDGSLILKVGQGLKTDSSGLTINTAAPLQVDENILKLALGQCFYTKENVLTLKTGIGLTQVNNQVELLPPSSPLKIVNDKLTLNIGSSLTTHNEFLEIAAPIKPLTFVDNKLALDFGSSLNLVNNKLEIAAPMSPLTLSKDKLGLNIGNSLKLENDKLEVQTPNIPLALSNSKLSLNTSNNFYVKENNLSLKDPHEPLSVHSDGSLKLNYGNSLKVSTSGLEVNSDNTLAVSSQGTIGIKIAPYGYIYASNDGLALRYNPDTFETNANSLKVLVNKLDCIKAESGGLWILKKPPIVTVAADDGYNTAITLNYDTKVFKVENSQLTLKTMPTSSVFYSIQMGYKNLSTYDLLVTLPTTRVAKVSAFCTLTCSAGIVTGTVQVRGRAGQWPKLGSSVVDGIRFGMVICPTSDVDAVANLSGFPKTSYKPNEPGTPGKFTPNHLAGVDTTVTLDPSSNWYIASEYLPVSIPFTFVPGGTPSLEFSSGKLSICTAKIKSSTASFNALYCEFQMKQDVGGLNFFDVNTDPDTFFITPPIPIQYQGEDFEPQ
nr:fiber [Tern adenovirus]